MKSIRMLKRRVLPACVTAGLAFSAAAQADDFDIDATFSGAWTQPNHQNQGFLVQISSLRDDRRFGIVYWFTYGEDSQPHWYYMVGDVDDNEIEGTLFKTLDIAFLEPFSEADDEDGNGVPDDREGSVVEIGEMIVSFDSCDTGLVGWDTDDLFLLEGEVEIERLITVEGLECDEEALFDDDSSEDEDSEDDDFEDDDSEDDESEDEDSEDEDSEDDETEDEESEDEDSEDEESEDDESEDEESEDEDSEDEETEDDESEDEDSEEEEDEGDGSA